MSMFNLSIIMNFKIDKILMISIDISGRLIDLH